jgi:hypothetical protein
MLHHAHLYMRSGELPFAVCAKTHLRLAKTGGDAGAFRKFTDIFTQQKARFLWQF